MFDKIKNILGGLKHETPPSAQVTDEFVRHLKRGDRAFQLDLGTTSINLLINDALRIDPRLVYTVMAFSTQNKGAYHDVSVTYRPNQAVRIDDILVLRADDPDKCFNTLRDAVKKMPKELYIVINDIDAMKANLDSLLNSSEVPQFVAYNGNGFQHIENSDNWCCFRLELDFDMSHINEANNKRVLDMELNRIESLLHLKNLMPEVKIFLALSYIAQETTFSLDGGTTAYNALCEKKASAKGFAEGYAELLNHAGITCRVIEGNNLAIPGVEYAWTLVRLQGDWYHVDPAVTLQGCQLYLGAFLCSDSVMRQDYSWIKSEEATGFLYNATQVLDTVRMSSRTLLSMGVPNKYVNPPIES